MVTVTYTRKNDVNSAVSMHNARVDIGGGGDRVKYRIIRVTNRVRKPNNDCSAYIWTDEYHSAYVWIDEYHYECQELEQHFFSRDEWKTMVFHDEHTDENGVSEFASIDEIKNWLIALDGDRIEEVKLFKGK